MWRWSLRDCFGVFKITLLSIERTWGIWFLAHSSSISKECDAQAWPIHSTRTLNEIEEKIQRIPRVTFNGNWGINGTGILSSWESGRKKERMQLTCWVIRSIWICGHARFPGFATTFSSWIGNGFFCVRKKVNHGRLKNQSMLLFLGLWLGGTCFQIEVIIQYSRSHENSNTARKRY